MQKVDLKLLKDQLDKDLESQTISGRTLLDRFAVIDDNSRKTAAYLDHKYAPFYYSLGKYIAPESIIEIGFTLGLLSASFLTSCHSVKRVFGFKEISTEFVPIRLGKANIKLVFKGKSEFYIGRLYDERFPKIGQIDLCVVNDEVTYDKHLEYLDFIWPQISENGLIVAEYIDKHEPAKDAFFAFCESKNRKPEIFKTRYGTGILEK